MFRVHNLQELQRIRKLLGAHDNSTVDFPVDIYRTATRISAFQYGSDSEFYTYMNAQGGVQMESSEGTTDHRASRAKEELEYERIVGGGTRPKTCHDCGCEEGAIHEYGCDMETCPFCGGQLASCRCVYEHLGYTYDLLDAYHGLGEKVFNEGVSQAEVEKFLCILDAKGRIPYIIYPVICQKCGRLSPALFKVPDEEWAKYIEPEMRSTVICQQCYDAIKEHIDSHTV